MPILNKKEAVILFIGDVFIFFVSLFLTLFLRYRSLSLEIVYAHAEPFSIIFLVWLLVFFIAGLYDSHTTFLKGRLPSIIFNSQLVNSVIAVLFFYFIPYFGITPKTNLFITLLISFAMVLFWRRYGYKLASLRKRENAIIVGAGNEAKKLEQEINANPRYGMKIVSFFDLDKTEISNLKEEIEKEIKSSYVPFMIIDFRDQRVSSFLPGFYELLFQRVRFVDIHNLYETIFSRMPLSLIKEDWILENITNHPKPAYDFFKRAADIVIAFVLGIISLAVYPFVALAIRLESKGSIFISQTRVGQYGKAIRLTKFRTMTKSEQGNWLNSDNKVTRVGTILRRGRIDELPQLWNVILGDVSLIGPRPEFAGPVKLYSEAIPYYNVRHIIKPGLSGWAQINHELHPHHKLDKEETRNKLSYDLYYIKNRSLMLDVKIALRTIKILLLFVGK